MASRVKPVTRLGLLDPAQSHGPSWIRFNKKIIKSNKKIKKIKN
jgi:hypothetical protein